MNLSTTFKLSSLVIITFLLLISVTVIKMKQAEDLRHISIKNQSKLKALGWQLAQGSNYLTREIRRYVQVGEAIHFENFWKEVNETKTREVVDDLLNMNALPEELSLIKKSKYYSDKLINTEKQAMEAVKDGNFIQARKLVFGNYYNQQKELILGNIQTFQETINKRTQKEVDQANKTATFYLYTTNILLTIAILLVAILQIGFMRKRILAPLETLKDQLKSFSDESPYINIKLNNNDEIYELTESIRNLIEQNYQFKKTLETNKRSLSNLISNLNGMVYHCKNDKDWTMDFVSNGSIELTGYKPEDIEKNRVISFNEIIHPDDRETVWNNVQEALELKDPFVLNYRITTAAGELKYVTENGRGVWLKNGELEGLQGFITDVTESFKNSQELNLAHKQLIHSEKLASLGKLTGSISHEFNNPIQGVRNVISILSHSTHSEKDLKLAKLGKKECDRMAEMIRGLRDFYKPTLGETSLVAINQCIDEVLALQIKSLRERCIQVNQQFSKQLPLVEIVEDQIKQVILNLVQNAADAISGEGQITFTTKSQNSKIVIEIKDTGHGIPKENKESIFEPFITTKKKKGTGLGLSISYGIIQDHSGNIEVESEVGKGTTFKVSLPIKKETINLSTAH